MGSGCWFCCRDFGLISFRGLLVWVGLVDVGERMSYCDGGLYWLRICYFGCVAGFLWV